MAVGSILSLNYVPTPADDTIPVSTLTPGSFPANNWSGFTTPATTVSTVSGSKFLFPSPDNDVLVCQSTRSLRDYELTSWTARGTFYLRMANGSALVFYNNSAANAGAGLVEVGIVQNFVPTSGNDFGGTGNFYWYYVNQNPVGTLAGYSGTYTAGNTFTFGVSGFNVYLKINGVQVFSYTEWRLGQNGTTAIWAHNGAGCTDVTVHYLAQKHLYSNIASKTFDTRDFGMRQVVAVTGSITSGSSSLVLASNVGFQVGDPIIIEIGGEAGAGATNSAGVGGVWPPLSYASTTAMNADTSQPSGTYAYDVSTGFVYVFNTLSAGVWARSATGGTGAQTYYQIVKLPLSLATTVSAVSPDGKTLTLATTALATTTNANIWLDCLSSYFLINQLPPATATMPPALSNVTLTIPAGNYRHSNIVTNPATLTLPSGLTIQGSGSSSTTLTSPKGCPGAAFDIEAISTNNVQVSDFSYVGNHSNVSGFMFQVNSTGSVVVSGTPPAVTINALSGTVTGLVIKNINATDCWRLAAIGAGLNPLIDNGVFTLTTARLDYNEWMFGLDNSTGGSINNCRASGPYMLNAFELFACNGSKIVGCYGTNCSYSTNSSSSWTIDCRGVSTTHNTNCYLASQNSPGIDEPIFNISSNAFHSGGTGTFYPGIHTQSGYVDASNNTLKWFQVTADQPNVSITGSYPGGGGCSTSLDGIFIGPNYNAGSAEYGSMGMSDGASTSVTGIRIKGTAIGSPGHSSHFGNISLAGATSTVTNCVADVIQPGPTISGCQTNLAYGNC